MRTGDDRLAVWQTCPRSAPSKRYDTKAKRSNIVLDLDNAMSLKICHGVTQKVLDYGAATDNKWAVDN